jgi:BirA family biotin operon repressor/biotin-[acetyl-CoA-carboxylase] ligase
MMGWKTKIIHYQQVTSTNNLLKKMLQEKTAFHGTVILADFQTEGRGRGDHSWSSSMGMNLLMSLLIIPDIAVDGHFMLNEFLSLAIIDTIETYQLKAEVKWPNDIYLGKKKLAGLLLENNINQDRISTSILGIGLNLNQTDFPSDLPNPVSMRQMLGKEISREEFLDRLLHFIKLRYDQLQNGITLELHKQYKESLIGIGKKVQIIENSTQKSGFLKDIKPTGELVIQLEEQIRVFTYDEIQLLV